MNNPIDLTYTDKPVNEKLKKSKSEYNGIL